MKKIICLLLILMLTLSNGIVFADEEVIVSIDKVQAVPGSSVKANIFLQNCEKLVGVQFAVEYDADKLELTQVEAGNLLNNKTKPAINSDEPGIIYFMWDSLNELNKEGVILVLCFEYKENATENAFISLDTDAETLFIDYDLNDVAYSHTSGYISPILKDTDEKEEKPATPEAPKNEQQKEESVKYNEEITNEVGEEFYIEIENLPDEYTKEDIVWHSHDVKIATVDENGKITGISAGKTIITAVSLDGEFFEDYILIINEKTEDPADTAKIWIVVALVAVVVVILVLSLKKQSRRVKK